MAILVISQTIKVAQHILIDAQEKFDALPASIRKRFDNNPLNMVEFCKDPENHEEGVKLGLFNKPVVSVDDGANIVPPIVSKVDENPE